MEEELRREILEALKELRKALEEAIGRRKRSESSR